MLNRVSALRILIAIVIAMSLGGCSSLVEKVKSLSPFGKSKVQRNDLRLIIDRGHDGDIMAIKFNPSGKLLASGSDDRTVKIWDVPNQCELRTIETGFKVIAIAFSHDGTLIAAGSYENKEKNHCPIQVWNALTGEKVMEFFTDDTGVNDLAFTPDDKSLAVTCTRGKDKQKDGAAVRFWNIKTGKCTATFYGPEEHSCNSLCFSPDGENLVGTTSGGLITVWNVSDQKKLKSFDCDFEDATRAVVTYSPDGKTLGLLNATKVVLINIEDGTKKSVTLPGKVDQPSIAFSPNGKAVIATTKDMIYMLSTDDLHEILRKDRETKAVAFAPNGRCFATSRADHISVYDSGDAERWYSLGLDGPPMSMADFSFSPDGKSIVTCEANAKLWDLTGKRNVRMFDYQEAAISPDGSLIAVGGYVFMKGYTDTVEIRNTRTGGILRTIKTAGPVQQLCFSSDGKHIFSIDEEERNRKGDYGASMVQSFDVATGKENLRVAYKDKEYDTPWEIDSKTDTAACPRKAGIDIIDMRTGKTKSSVKSTGDINMDLSEGARFLSVVQVHDLCVHDLEHGNRVIMKLTEPKDYIRTVGSLAISPDGKTLVTSSRSENATRVWSVPDGKLLDTLDGTAGIVRFSPDGSLLGSAENRMLVLRKTDDWTELAKIVPLAHSEWVVLDPEGRFDSSKRGRMVIHFAKGTAFLSLDQLWNQYYQPNLLSRVVGFNSEPLRAAPAMTDIGLAPEVELEPPAKGSGVLNIKIKKRDGGLGKVVVRVNGKELPAQAQPRALDLGGTDVKVRADLMQAASAEYGKTNKVSVVVYNADGTMTSRDCQVSWAAPESEAEPTHAKPELYAIICGTSKYKNSRLNLTFPAKDATDFSKSLEIGAPSLFGTEKVHIILLTTDSESDETPTKAHLEAAFAAAKKSRPDDVFVVYMAGHGVTVKEPADTYYYLLTDAESADLSNKKLRDASTVSSEELADWITRIPAKHQVMIFDTCGAGGLIKKLAQRRDFSTDGIRAIELLNRRAGTHVLLGCAADAVSYESSQYSQGLLTYALLEGMRTTKGLHKDSEGYEQDVLTLFNYARNRVPELAQSIGGIQEPRVVADPEGSFAIGLLKPEDTGKIPLAKAKHRLTPPRLVDADQVDDTLDLSNRLGIKLSDLATPTKSRSTEPYVYITDADLADAIRVFGKYKVSGNKVTVTVNMLRNHEQLEKFSVEGTKDDLPKLVGALSDKIRATLRKVAT